MVNATVTVKMCSADIPMANATVTVKMCSEDISMVNATVTVKMCSADISMVNSIEEEDIVIRNGRTPKERIHLK